MNALKCTLFILTLMKCKTINFVITLLTSTQASMYSYYIIYIKIRSIGILNNAVGILIEVFLAFMC